MLKQETMKKIYAIIAIVITSGVVVAQDPQFSQYYAAPLYLNPGFTGTTQQHRVVVNHRVQWPNLPQAFATYALSYDYFKPDLKSGFGVLLTTDKAGAAGLRSTTAGFIYSYKIQTPTGWLISPGLYFGYGVRDLNFNELLFGDQVEFDNSGAPTLDPAQSNFGNNQYFDFGSGIVMYNSKVFMGIAAYHMNTPDNSLLDTDSPLPLKLNIHGGIRVPLYADSRHLTRVSSITPSFIYRRQGEFQQLDAGLQYHVEPVVVGLWYRGIPVIKNVVGNTSRDAVVFIMGLQFLQFEFGYSYDFTISELGVDSGGAHEVSLVWQFEVQPLTRRVKRKHKILPCPTFTSKNFWKN